MNANALYVVIPVVIALIAAGITALLTKSQKGRRAAVAGGATLVVALVFSFVIWAVFNPGVIDRKLEAATVAAMGTPTPSVEQQVATAVAATLAAQPGSTPTPVGSTPVAQASAGAAPAAADPVYSSLKYDETDCGASCLAVGQKQLVALYLRPAFDKGQAAQEAAIVAIQQEAANVKAGRLEGETVVIPDVKSQAWMCWHSNKAFITQIPADTSDVFGTHTLGVGKVWVVGPFAEPVPDRVHRTFSASAGKVWCVAVR